MKSDKVKQVVIPAVALLLICLITTALLGFTDKLTREPIARENALTAQRSREQVCPAAADFEKVDISLQGTNAEVHRALDSDGNTVGFAVATSAHGYGGDIKVMTGIDCDGVVIGINVYDNSGETPGLGANTSTQTFMSQYSGVEADKGFVVSKNASKEPDKHPVDAVTGATISSNAVTSAVNEAIDIYNNYCREGK